MGRFWPGKAIVATLTLMTILCLFTTALAYDTIPYGEISDQVRAMQQALQNEGYFPETVDGVFGPETIVAICRFQSDHDLYVDGEPGNVTLSKLYGKSGVSTDASTVTQAQYSQPDALRYGCRGARVTQLQQALYDAGYYTGSIDGYYGSHTCAAVKTYQWDFELTVDGVVGSQTWASLFDEPDIPANDSQLGTYGYPVG